MKNKKEKRKRVKGLDKDFLKRLPSTNIIDSINCDDANRDMACCPECDLCPYNEDN